MRCAPVKVQNAQYLLENEYDNDSEVRVRGNIVESSKKYGMLSYLTVFLCLEPDTIAVGESTGDHVISSIDETESVESTLLKVYPNPFTDKLTIRFSKYTAGDEIHSISILDIEGRVLENIDFSPQSLSDDIIVEWQCPEDLLPGFYVIRIVSTSGVYTAKVIRME